MDNNLDLVVILKRIERNNTIYYVPVYSEVGIYDDKNDVFINNRNKKYKHVIEGEEYAFMGRLPLSKYYDAFSNSSLLLVKGKAIKKMREHKYILSESEDKIPIILQVKKDNECNIFLDNDLINYYNRNYPELEINKMVNSQEMSISEVYEELTSKIIGQDEQIKQILSSIWKQYNNKDKTFNYNMLINGPEGVGKTTIFKLLEESLDIPCVIINAKRLQDTGYIENILLRLLEKTNFDIVKAENGILVIDKLEEISTNSKERHNTSSKALQEVIINLIDEGIFTIDTIDGDKYRFSMNKLLVIGLGNFNNNESLRNTQVGFNTTDKENTMDTYGIIPVLANRFPILIEMNELTLDDYINIIKNSLLSSLNTNREFLNKKNISLNVSDEVIELIAKLAYDRKLGAKSINEIIESSLALAEFEIASNPSLYESLIIDENTIRDKNNYTLIKRKK